MQQLHALSHKPSRANQITALSICLASGLWAFNLMCFAEIQSPKPENNCFGDVAFAHQISTLTVFIASF